MSEKARVRRANPRESEEVVNEYEPAGTMLPGDVQPPASLQRPPRPARPATRGRYVTPPADDPNDPIARRIEEVRAKRRERGPMNISGLRQKLSVPASAKDDRFVYRWVNDTSTRQHDMKSRDWEYVDSQEIAKDERNTGTGTRIERIADERTVKGAGVTKCFLMRKPREFYEEDKAIEQDRIARNEEGLRQGKEVRNEQGGIEPGMYNAGMRIGR